MQGRPWERYQQGSPQPRVSAGAPQRDPSAVAAEQARLGMDAERLRLAQEAAQYQSANEQRAAAEFAAEQAERQRTEQARADGMRDARSQIQNVIDNAREAQRLSREGWFATGFGTSLGRTFGGTSGTALDGLLNQIGSNTAFDRLQRMRNESQTGGALGQVSERELALLRDSIGSMDINQPDAQFQEQMGNIINAYQGVLDRLPNEQGEVVAPQRNMGAQDILSAGMEAAPPDGGEYQGPVGEPEPGEDVYAYYRRLLQARHSTENAQRAADAYQNQLNTNRAPGEPLEATVFENREAENEAPAGWDAGAAFLNSAGLGIPAWALGEQETMRARRADDPTGTMIGEIGGLVAGGGGATALGRLAAARATPALLQGGRAAQYGRTAAGEGAIGATYGGASGEDAGTMAALGVGGGVLGRFAGGRIFGGSQPRVDPDVQTLQRFGVQPTIGQTRGGMTQRAENVMRSTMGVGDMIEGAQGRVADQLQRSAINSPLRRMGVDELPANVPTGTEAQAYLAEQSGRLFDEARSQMAVQMDQPLVENLQGIFRQAETGEIAADAAERLQRIYQNRVASRFTDGRLSGGAYQRVHSELGDLASRNQTGNPDLADGLRAMQDILDDAATRHSPPEAIAMYQRAREAFPDVAAIQNAGRSNAGGGVGSFTPSRLNSGIQQADRTVRSNRSVTGNWRPQGDANNLQDLALAAQRRLPDTVPVGSASRTIPMAQGAAMVASAPISVPATGLGMLAYTPMGQRLLNAMSTRPLPGVMNGNRFGRFRQPTGLLGAAGAIGLAPR